MPNSVGPNGITIQTNAEILSELLNGAPGFPGMFAIYGSNINVAPNSPDGQMLEIITQAKLDGLDLIHEVASSFDPDQAIGILLDQRCAINGVTRQAGTATIINVNVTVSQALTLTGLNTDPTTAFTVSDSTGNNYQLVLTYAFGGAGTQSLAFQATVLGALNPLANTLTVIVTTILGVVSVNNPATSTTVGTPEESDASLRMRRAQSVSKPSVGYVASAIGALYNVKGVTNVEILENTTGSTDSNGVTGHSVWIIVAGTATTADIANAIYLKRHAASGQRGTVSYSVMQADGSFFSVLFDRPTAQPLWISFNVVPIAGGTVDPTYIRAQLLASLSYAINQQADITTITSLVRTISPSASVSAAGVSADNATYVSLLSPSAVNNQFATAAVRVIINGISG